MRQLEGARFPSQPLHRASEARPDPMSFVPTSSGSPRVYRLPTACPAPRHAQKPRPGPRRAPPREMPASGRLLRETAHVEGAGGKGSRCWKRPQQPKRVTAGEARGVRGTEGQADGDTGKGRGGRSLPEKGAHWPRRGGGRDSKKLSVCDRPRLPSTKDGTSDSEPSRRVCSSPGGGEALRSTSPGDDPGHTSR